jgi:DNA-binding SARP family transcriptional activator
LEELVLNFSILGPLQLRTETASYQVSGIFQATLLIALLTGAGRLVPVDSLMEEVWGGGRPAQPENALQAHISRLRRRLKKLEPDRADDRLISYPGGYRLIVRPDELDALVFSSEIKALDRTVNTLAPAETVSRLRAALSAWRGPVFGGVIGGSLCQASARRYEETRLRAFEMLFDAELACGNHAGIIAELSALVMTSSAFQVSYCEQLVVALYRSGRQKCALETCRKMHLPSAEFEMHGSRRLRNYEHAILTHDPILNVASVRQAIAMRSRSESVPKARPPADQGQPARLSGSPLS